MSLISDHPSVESGTKHGDSRLVHRGAYLEDSHAFKGSGPSKRLLASKGHASLLIFELESEAGGKRFTPNMRIVGVSQGRVGRMIS